MNCTFIKKSLFLGLISGCATTVASDDTPQFADTELAALMQNIQKSLEESQARRKITPQQRKVLENLAELHEAIDNYLPAPFVPSDRRLTAAEVNEMYVISDEEEQLHDMLDIFNQKRTVLNALIALKKSPSVPSFPRLTRHDMPILTAAANDAVPTRGPRTDTERPRHLPQPSPKDSLPYLRHLLFEQKKK